MRQARLIDANDRIMLFLPLGGPFTGFLPVASVPGNGAVTQSFHIPSIAEGHPNRSFSFNIMCISQNDGWNGVIYFTD
ncbi:hypothetical protein [Niveispirillum sp.]|uniref:hypothetical protein n=1 Tax=Niveispirillum sp. TaxID=1917217 RepID=UPI0012E1DEB8